MTTKQISRVEAAVQGKTRYFTGIPCLRHHVAERLTSTAQCVECNRIRRQTDEFKEKQSAYNRGYNQQVRAALRAARAKEKGTYDAA